MADREDISRMLDDLCISNVSTLPLTAGAATGTAAHQFNCGVIHTTITLTADTALIAGGDNANKGGGVKIFDFPTGAVFVLASRIKGTLDLVEADMSTTAGEIGLGTTVASGAINVLGGTAAFENVHEGGIPALGNISAAGTLAFTSLDAIKSTVLPSDGTVATALDLYLNCATAFADATASDLNILSGATVELWWIWLPP